MVCLLRRSSGADHRAGWRKNREQGMEGSPGSYVLVYSSAVPHGLESHGRGYGRGTSGRAGLFLGTAGIKQSEIYPVDSVCLGLSSVHPAQMRMADLCILCRVQRRQKRKGREVPSDRKPGIYLRAGKRTNGERVSVA